ncbi:MAG: NlpC/P60 family protein [Syntrophales bacterium]|jgi:cell wall-associated NlpC family hydrolase|nr:NlpC/P60 family protein [Syntrophales bacterium]NLN59792.1 LysM peptidoglycan-binding domain-containing protein [Deltaproteobacteria bacterium]
MTNRRIALWLGLLVLFMFCLPTNGSSAETYRIKKGDTLSAIAKRYHVSIKSLKETNHLKSDKLSLNQVLTIPTQDKTKSIKTPCQGAASNKHQNTTYVVRKGDTFTRIAKVTGVSVRDLEAINRVSSNRIRPGQKLRLTYPEPANLHQGNPESMDSLDHFDLNDLEEIENPPDNHEDVLSEEDGEQLPRFLGKWDDSKERQLLVKISKGFLGAPYRFGGASLKGLDCSAFVKRIYSIFDVNLPRTAREQAQMGQKVSRDKLAVGDLVFFNTRRYHISHVGIYIGNNEFVHAASGKSKKVRVSSLNEPYYNKRFIKAVRIKELEDKL